MEPEPHRDRERLLLEEGRALRSLARSLLGRDDAEDVVQGTLTAALAAPPHTDGFLQPWLRVTLRNLATVFWRSEARRRVRERAVARPETDRRADPAAIAMQTEVMQDVASAVRALDEPFRTVVVLRFWHAMSIDAIAGKIGTPRNTVRSRLQRGLARLRSQLDAEYGERKGWAAPLGACVGARTTATTMAGIGMGVAGLLMKTKLLVGAAAVFIAALAVPLLWSPAATSELTPPPQIPVAAAKDIGSQPEADRPVRKEVATAVAPPQLEVTSDLPPVTVPPWTAVLLVVDEDERHIADAKVTIWVARRSQGPSILQGKTSYSGHEQAPRLELHTDSTGHATATLDLDAYAAAASWNGHGGSRDQWIFSSQAGREIKLVLEQEILLHGRVIEDDGTPVPDVEVAVSIHPSTGLIDRGWPTPPGTVVTDADGAFRVPVQREVSYALQTTHAGRKSFPVSLSVADRHPSDVTLTFPGAITLGGTVVDAHGEPVANACVKAWRDYARDDPARNDAERVEVTADLQGHFSTPVQRHARYQLLAAAEGHATSDLSWTETTPARPHVEVRLVLETFTTIRGRVVHGDGSPFPGLRVLATPEAGDRNLWTSMPNREDRFPAVRAATVADDGSFALTVHPGSSWTLVVFQVKVNGRVLVLQSGVNPRRDDVVITVTDAQLQGCVVHGKVTRADGQPARDYEVEVVDCGPDGQMMTSSAVEARIDGDTFECPPLPLGQRFAVWVNLSSSKLAGRFGGPLAPASTAAFLTDRAELHFDLRLEAWGSLPVRVLEADGAPARRVSVYLQRVESTGGDLGVLPVDAEGRAVVKKCVPGAYRLFLTREREQLHTQELTVAPGLNPDVVVRLPAR